MQGEEGKIKSPSQEKRSKCLRDVARKVMLMQAVTRCFIHSAERVIGSAFWGDVKVSNFPREDASYREEETSGKDKKGKVDCAFDTSVFRTQYEFTFPVKAIEVTLRRPEERSEQDVRYIRSMMMGILSFRRYSSNMQLILSRVVYYRRFGRGRVIVRKGHRGDSFYFVFSGVITVTQDEDGSSALLDPEPILLHKGASFGEVALLKGLRRNATVVCMEETEFLVVDRNEFFMNKLDQELQKELKYRFHFFRSLDLFSSWSDQSLETLADHCKTEECRYSQVVLNDTRETKNIVFVTKGRCEVLRLVDLSQCPAFHKWIKHHGVLVSKPRMDNNQETLYLGSGIHGISSRSNDEAPNIGTERRKVLKKGCPVSVEDVTREAGLSASLPESPGSLGLPGGLTAAVYLRIDSINPGQYFRGVDVEYIESCFEREGRMGQEPSLICLPTTDRRDPRSMVIISQGAEVIRIKLDKFSEMADLSTLKKLKEDGHSYPSDNDLCQVFLEQNRWKIFKDDLVSNLSSIQWVLPKHVPGRERAKRCRDRRGILELGTHQSGTAKIWTTPIKPKASDPGRQVDAQLPSVLAPVRLIHGINIPKLCGKRIMW